MKMIRIVSSLSNLLRQRFIIIFLAVLILCLYSYPAYSIEDPKKVEDIVKLEREITREKERALVNTFYKEGKRLLAEEKYDEAIDQFSRILEINPKHSGAKNGIETIKERLAQKKINASPAMMAMRLVRIGRLKYSDKDYDGAMEDFQDALVLDYKNAEALEWLKRSRRAKDLSGMKEEDRDLEREMEMATNKKELREKRAMIEVESAYIEPEKKVGEMKIFEDALTFSDDEEEKARATLIANLRKKMVPAISLVEADIRDVIRELMEITGITIVIDEGALNEVAMDEPLKITLMTVNSLPLLDVLDIALKATYLNYKVLNNYIWVSTPEKLKQEEMVTQTYKLRYGVRKIRKVGLKEFVTKSSGD